MCVCVWSEYRLSVRPRKDRFTKPLGSSIVLTCQLEWSDGDHQFHVPVTSLQWLDQRLQSVSEQPARSAILELNASTSLAISGVKFGGIPPDLRSDTSYLRSTTSNNRSCTSQLTSGIFLLGSTTVLSRINCNVVLHSYFAICICPCLV